MMAMDCTSPGGAREQAASADMQTSPSPAPAHSAMEGTTPAPVEERGAMSAAAAEQHHEHDHVAIIKRDTAPQSALSPTMRDTDDNPNANTSSQHDATIVKQERVQADGEKASITNEEAATATSPGGNSEMSGTKTETPAAAPTEKKEDTKQEAPSLLTGEPPPPATTAGSKAKKESGPDGQPINLDSDDESEDGHSSGHVKGESDDLSALGDISHLTPLQQFHLQQRLKKEKGVSCHRQSPLHACTI
jgi:hypothetical protein